MLVKIKKLILDLFFPVECVVCGRDNEYFCQNCRRLIEYVNDELCFLCNENMAARGVCQSCAASSYLDEIVAVAKYKDTVIEKVIHELKFNFIEDLAKILANLLSFKLTNLKYNFDNAVFIPIPLHKKRYLERGFNQSALLARYVCDKLNCEVNADILKRQKYTSQQAKLNRAERMANTKDAFVCVKPLAVKNKVVYLLDDVLTSGATMNEAAKVLKENGALKVVGVVVAHG